MDNIFGRVVMRYSRPVLSDGHKVRGHILKETVDLHSDSLVLGVTDTPVGRRAILAHGLRKGFFIGKRKRRLLDIEERTDLAVADRGEAFLLLCVQFIEFFPRYLLVRIRLVPVLVPPVPGERDSFLSSLDGIASFLGFGKGDVQVGLIAAPLAVKRQKEGIEGRYGIASGIKPGTRLPARIEEGTAIFTGPVKRFCQKLLLALCRILFCLSFLSHINVFLWFSVTSA